MTLHTYQPTSAFESRAERVDILGSSHTAAWCFQMAAGGLNITVFAVKCGVYNSVDLDLVGSSMKATRN
jgi:hypothetical protein